MSEKYDGYIICVEIGGSDAVGGDVELNLHHLHIRHVCGCELGRVQWRWDEGSRVRAHEFLWWFHEGNRAVRVGNWKLVSWGTDGLWELFDLQVDRSETKNLAMTFPDKVRELEQIWKTKLEEFQELASRDLPKKPIE